MAQKNTITLAQMEQLRSMLQTLPPKEKKTFNAREIVKILHSEIQKLVSVNGYTFAEIADAFSKSGMEITASTIAAYARELALVGKKPSKSKAATQKGTRSHQPTVEKRIANAAEELPKAPAAEAHSTAIALSMNALPLDDVLADDALAYIAGNANFDASSTYKTDKLE